MNEGYVSEEFVEPASNDEDTWMSTRSSRTATVGTIAPSISLPMADGSQWDLSEAVTSGPVVLVFLRGFF